MKSILQQIKPYRIYLLAVLAAFLFMRSCGKDMKISRLERTVKTYSLNNDSLINVVSSMHAKRISDSTYYECQLLRAQRDVHLFYHDEISNLNRSPQMMQFHTKVIANKDSLEAKLAEHCSTRKR